MTDFGLARVLSVPSATVVQSGTVMGSVHYLSPEQAQGEETDPSQTCTHWGWFFTKLFPATCPSRETTR